MVVYTNNRFYMVATQEAKLDNLKSRTVNIYR